MTSDGDGDAASIARAMLAKPPAITGMKRTGCLATVDPAGHETLYELEHIGAVRVINAVIHLLAAFLAQQKLGVAQYFEVVGDGGTTQLEQAGNFIDAHLFIGLEHQEDLLPRRITERRKKLGEFRPFLWKTLRVPRLHNTKTAKSCRTE